MGVGTRTEIGSPLARGKPKGRRIGVRASTWPHIGRERCAMSRGNLKATDLSLSQVPNSRLLVLITSAAVGSPTERTNP